MRDSEDAWMAVRTVTQSACLGSMQMFSALQRTVFEPHSSPVARDGHRNVKVVSHLPSTKAQSYANARIDVHSNVNIIVNSVAVDV